MTALDDARELRAHALAARESRAKAGIAHDSIQVPIDVVLSLTVPPTEAQVEAAARVFYESQTGHDGLATSTYRENWLAMARRALEAARDAS